MEINTGNKKSVRYETIKFGETFIENGFFYIKTNLKTEDGSYAACNLKNGGIVEHFFERDFVTPVDIKGVINYDD